MLCHIFKTGEHTDSNGNKKKWTIEDLDKICFQFNNVHSTVPICVGHPKSNSPAYGWIDEVKRIGENLYCSFKGVQEEFKTAFRKGLFQNRSISLDKDLNIRHLAFLGAQAPAIKGLEEFCFQDDECSTTYEFSDLQDKEEKMENNLEQMLKAKDEEILKLKQEIEAKVKAEKIKEFEDFALKAVEKGNILPKHKECIVNIMSVCDNAEPFNFTDSGEVSALKAVKDFISSLKIQNFQDIATAYSAKQKSDLTDAKAYARELQKIMKEENIDLCSAYNRLNK